MSHVLVRVSYNIVDRGLMLMCYCGEEGTNSSVKIGFPHLVLLILTFVAC